MNSQWPRAGSAGYLGTRHLLLLSLLSYLQVSSMHFFASD